MAAMAAVAEDGEGGRRREEASPAGKTGGNHNQSPII